MLRTLIIFSVFALCLATMNDFYVEIESVKVKQLFDAMDIVGQDLQFMRQVLDMPKQEGVIKIPATGIIEMTDRRGDFESQADKLGLWLTLILSENVSSQYSMYIKE